MVTTIIMEIAPLLLFPTAGVSRTAFLHPAQLVTSSCFMSDCNDDISSIVARSPSPHGRRSSPPVFALSSSHSTGTRSGTSRGSLDSKSSSTSPKKQADRAYGKFAYQH